MDSSARDVGLHVGELYHKSSDMQYEVGVATISTLLKPEAGQSILDLGCGTGRLSVVLSSLVGPNGRIVAVDPSKPRIETAIEKSAKENADNLVFLEGDIDLATRYGHFDLIFTNFVLHWLSEDEVRTTLQKAVECLKPGGRLVGNILIKGHELAGAILMTLTGKNLAETLGYYAYPTTSWKAWFLEAGLEVVHCREFTNRRARFENVYKYFQYFQAVTDGKLDLIFEDQRSIAQLLADHGVSDPMAEYNVGSMALEFTVRKPVASGTLPTGSANGR